MNILLITADQWRADHAPGGLSTVPTPQLDAFAAEATRFARHYTNAMPCGPARASLLTELYPHKHRSIQNGVPLDARHPTLFTEARRAGYRPLLFGYTDTTLDPRGRPARDPDRGDYENLCPGLVAEVLLTERATPWLAHLQARGHAIDDPDAGRDGVFFRGGFGEAAPFAAEDSETAFLTDRFLAWLTVAGKAPFFAHLSYITPHPPFAAAAPWHARIGPDDVALPLPGGAAPHPLTAAMHGTVRLASFVPGLPGLASAADDAVIRRIRAIYAGLVCELDHHLGRVFAALRDSGRWDDTLIVVTADHGEQLFDHGLLGKAGYFDGAAHIPLIVRDPRAGAQGHVVTRLTEAVDVMPTILQACGLAPPRNCDGHSLLPFCRGTVPPDWRDAVYWSFDFRDAATQHYERALGLPSEWCSLQVVRTARLKYVHFAGLSPVLFDLAADPHEQVDRAGDPSCTGMRLEALDRLATWRMRHEERTLTGLLCRDGAFIDADQPAAG